MLSFEICFHQRLSQILDNPKGGINGKVNLNQLRLYQKNRIFVIKSQLSINSLPTDD